MSFILGCIVGGTFGAVFMCLFQMSGRGDD